jgi:hypothetical protein
LGALAATWLLVSGCGADDDDPGQNTGGSVGSADTGTGPAHDFHEIGHVGYSASCKEHFAECVSVCVGGDGDG